MEELIKKWQEFKNRDKTCICIDELEQYSAEYSNVDRIRVSHDKGCPAEQHLITDVGMFLDSLLPQDR